jgi:peptidoglycan/LPS O-acetylase OafA/YrhL
MKQQYLDDGRADGKLKPIANHEFRPDINGLRALAVLSVLGFHAGLPGMPGGFVGVDIFFVISGYLISRIILSEREAGKFSLIGFYGKRVKRILPALLLVLAATWLMGWFVLTPEQFRRLGGHMEASSYFSVNLWLYRQSGAEAGYFHPDARYFQLLHLWSLSIEEQFYLIWPALLLGLFRARRFIGVAIAVIFLASLIFCIVLTNTNSTGAFYFLSTRAWELALGAWLAQREVFSQPSLASMRVSNLRSGLGVALMLASVVLLNDEAPWPGFLALAPAVGCGLVIASPGANWGRVLLGHRPAQFFGLISYPLYLWHWPLLATAHNLLGDHLSALLTALLLGLSVLLAWLTWRFLERPVASAYKKHPVVTAALLLVVFALAGLLGSYTRSSGGIPQRFSPLVQATFKFRDIGAPEPKVNCGESRTKDFDTLDVARAKARAYYVEKGCLKLDHPDKPTIVLLGDSHVLHLIQGMETVYGDRANIVVMSALGCAPLVAQTDWPRGLIGSTRCKAINEEVFRELVALKPAAIIVGAYYVQFYENYNRHFPTFLADFDANVAALRQAGVNSKIVVVGQVPTWAPTLPYLVGRELLAEKGVSEFTRDHLNTDSLATEARLAAHPWGENVIYLSQFQALCGEKGCRRFVGPRVPEDMIAMDYGHYTPAGSNYAVKNILAPTLDAILKDAARQSPQ